MENILLIQFRKDSSAVQEKNCFLRYFQQRKNLKLKIINAFDKKIDFSNPQKLLRKTQRVILGGSGEFYFSGNKGEKEKIFQAILKKITPFVKHLLQNDFPSLGICFGHQILGYFLGEKVIADKNQAETGSLSVFLTKEGKKDPIFSGIPQKFIAQLGHKDSLEKLPKGASLLAKTKKCKITAFRYKNKIYGVQFHPELTLRDLKKRLRSYPEYKIKKMKLLPSSFPSKILKNFFNLC